MSQCSRDLTDAEWVLLDPLIPEPKRRKDGRGRPWRDRRQVLNGILFILRTGAPWADLPERYPSYQTCHRRFQQWVRSGVMRGILEALAEDLRTRVDSESAKPSSTVPSPLPKGGLGVGKTKRGKGTKIMAFGGCNGLPIAVRTESATPHEVTLVQQTLAEIFVLESGRWEVYVAAFPAFNEMRQVSANGGCQPMWRKDGKELFYRTLEGKLMVVEIKGGATLQAGVPLLLFQTPARVNPVQSEYCVSGDGKRFLFREPVGESATPITVVRNWTAGLNR